jgi:hypothetical protein
VALVGEAACGGGVAQRHAFAEQHPRLAKPRQHLLLTGRETGAAEVKPVKMKWR